MWRMLFHRHYLSFQGGHLKVYDYFRHVQALPQFEPQIYFTADTNWDSDNPFLPLRESALRNWEPERADVLFLAGFDWDALPMAGRNVRKPVINLIQHFRHTDPDHPLYRFLSNPAIRICVSRELASAVKATGQANGPVHGIANGIDFSAFPISLPFERRDIDLLIAGLKNPELAHSVAGHFRDRGVNVHCLTSAIPRPAFLDLLSRSRNTLFLPHVNEGFYLPALEGMALRTFVICPDGMGNRSFCLDRENCFRPEYDFASIVAAATRALALDESARERILRSAGKTISQHDLGRERSDVHALLKRYLLDGTLESMRNP